MKRFLVLAAMAALALSANSCYMLLELDGLMDYTDIDVSTLTDVQYLDPLASAEYADRGHWRRQEFSGNVFEHWYRVSNLSEYGIYYIHWQDSFDYDYSEAAPGCDVAVAVYDSDGNRLTGPQDSGYSSFATESGLGSGLSMSGDTTYYIRVIPYYDEEGSYYICVY